MEIKRSIDRDKRRDFPNRDLYSEGKHSLLPVIKEILGNSNYYGLLPVDDNDKHTVVGILPRTTCLDEKIAEILQIVLVDEDGKVIYSTYVKPYCQDRWHDSERIHHITPEMVKDAPYLHQIMPRVCEILNGADDIIYYGSFTLELMKSYGYMPAGFPTDLMRDFSRYYGEVSPKYKTFQFKSLYIAATHFEYAYPKGYNAEVDAAAMMFVYRKIKELKDSGQYEQIVEQNFKILKTEVRQEY